MNTTDTSYEFAGISDDEVRTKTSLSWDEWQVTLNDWEGDTIHFRSVIGYLKEKYDLCDYWAQIIAINYLAKR